MKKILTIQLSKTSSNIAVSISENFRLLFTLDTLDMTEPSAEAPSPLPKNDAGAEGGGGGISSESLRMSEEAEWPTL